VRSRNGNFPLLLTGFILNITLCFGAESYYIGYRFTAKNTQAYSEELSISKAMQPCISSMSSSPQLLLKRHSDESIEAVLRREKMSFIEYASLAEIRVKSNEVSYSNTIHSVNSFTLPTRCYAVEFNNESVTITSTQ
jgi:hypothetical protein